MSNLFQEVSTNQNGIEEQLLGPTYPYYKNIKSPGEIGMSDKGTIQQMGKDINGLIQYVELLVSGKSKASVTGGPLGNKLFLKTGAKCMPIDTCKDKNDPSTCGQTDRYIYIDNVPSGNIPFISSGLGVNFSEFKGLIPGAMGNLNVLNPFSIMNAFSSGSTPPCQEITMQTIDINNNKSSETHYVTLADIKSIDPCVFPTNINPVTGAKCPGKKIKIPTSVTPPTSVIIEPTPPKKSKKSKKKREPFQTGIADNASPVMSDDIMDQIYFASLSCVGIYILYRIMEKSK
jgi:hypothetical protein